MEKTTTPTVDEMAGVNITGNVIPPLWFKKIQITTKRGVYADLLAINLLADIVYWYKPTIVRDESTGAVIAAKKKFHGDMLQRSYDQFAEQFGTTKEIVKPSLKNLVSLGLITIQFRTVKVNGLNVPNVMFVEPVPQKINQFSNQFGEPYVGEITNTSKSNDLSYRVELAKTNTESNTETNKKEVNVKSNDLPLDAPKDVEPLKEKSKTNTDRQTAAAVLTHLNEKAKRQFPTEGKRAEGNLKIIIARLRDGFTAEEMKSVIDCKVSQWFADPKMCNYLKPSTLFIPSHLPDYLEEAKRATNPQTIQANGLNFDIQLNGSTEYYEKYWERTKEAFPNVAKEIRFFTASEFKKFIAETPEWFPMIHQCISNELYKKHIKTALAQLESDSNRKRTAQGGLYSYLTGYITQKAKE